MIRRRELLNVMDERGLKVIKKVVYAQKNRSKKRKNVVVEGGRFEPEGGRYEYEKESTKASAQLFLADFLHSFSKRVSDFLLANRAFGDKNRGFVLFLYHRNVLVSPEVTVHSVSFVPAVSGGHGSSFARLKLLHFVGSVFLALLAKQALCLGKLHLLTRIITC